MSTDEEFVIDPPHKLRINFSELWYYRELFYFFTWRDVKVKYKQAVLGILWAILQPLFLMIVFTLFFADALRIDTNGLPYPLFVFSGLLLWNLFSSGLTNSGNSMVTNANIIKKIYFPRLIIPISSILASLIDLCFATIIFIVLLFWYSPDINWLQAIVLWPAAIVLTCLATFGPGCWLAALNVKYRDFRYVIPFIVQALLFLTPVIYPVTIAAKPWMQQLLAINPMYAAIEIFRAPFSNGIARPDLIMISVVSGIVLFMIGVFYFKKTEMYFADLA